MGQVIVHAGGGIDSVELGEHGLEVGLGHAGKADEVLAGEDEDTLVAEECFEGFEPGIVETMAWYGKPDEVAWSTVTDVAVKMMTLLTFLALSPPSRADEQMGEPFFSGDTYVRIFFTAYASMNRITRAEAIDQLFPVCVDDEALFVPEIHPSGDHGRRNTFLLTHSRREFGCRRDRQR